MPGSLSPGRYQCGVPVAPIPNFRTQNRNPAGRPGAFAVDDQNFAPALPGKGPQLGLQAAQRFGEGQFAQMNGRGRFIPHRFGILRKKFLGLVTDGPALAPAWRTTGLLGFGFAFFPTQ